MSNNILSREPLTPLAFVYDPRTERGTIITAVNLPEKVTRWTPALKTIVVRAVTSKPPLIGKEEALRRYEITKEEFEQWRMMSRSVAAHRSPVPGTREKFLAYFRANVNVVLAKEMIMEHLYGAGERPEMDIVRVFVAYLRKRLRAEGGRERIDSVHGRGYVMRHTM